jgi:hypothetical protein
VGSDRAFWRSQLLKPQQRGGATSAYYVRARGKSPQVARTHDSIEGHHECVWYTYFRCTRHFVSKWCEILLVLLRISVLCFRRSATGRSSTTAVATAASAVVASTIEALVVAPPQMQSLTGTRLPLLDSSLPS